MSCNFNKNDQPYISLCYTYSTGFIINKICRDVHTAFNALAKMPSSAIGLTIPLRSAGPYKSVFIQVLSAKMRKWDKKVELRRKDGLTVDSDRLAMYNTDANMRIRLWRTSVIRRIK